MCPSLGDQHGICNYSNGVVVLRAYADSPKRKQHSMIKEGFATLLSLINEAQW